jgi:hypothetical protein
VLTISYVRYWLPIIVLLAPWAALGLLAIIQRVPARWRANTVALMFLGIALTSFSQVVSDPAEGLLRQRQAIDEHRQRARAVIAATGPNAVIVSHRMDKVFFPERAVVHVPFATISPPPQGPTVSLSSEISNLKSMERGSVRGRALLEDDAFLANLRTLVTRTPVYWYAPGEISAPGFTLGSVGIMPFGERLYRVKAEAHGG